MNHHLTYLALLILTGLSVLLTRWIPAHALLPALIMFFATFKFLLVAFRFMEMRRGHLAWKAGLLGFSLLFLAAFCLSR